MKYFITINKASRLLFLFVLVFGTITDIFAQDPVVITEDSTLIEENNQSNDLSNKTFIQRLRFGGGITGGAFSTNFTSIGVAPLVGYQTTPNLVLGIGLSYQYYRQFSSSLSLFGQKIFARQDLPFLNNIVDGSFLIAQIENYISPANSPFGKFSNPVLIGVGVGILNIMYDLNYSPNKNSPYGNTGSPLVIQINGLFF